MSAAAGLKYIGTRPVRPDGLEKVTGRANFGADHALPGMLFGKVVRSPHAHARIKSVDTSAAEAMPGVLAVVTAADFPDRSQMSWRRKGFNDNLLASDKVLYHGHAVAAVAATSNQAAEAAAGAVVVDYEVLDAVTDALAAMAPDAPVLHDDLFTEGLPETPETPSNLVKKQVISKGDVEAAFAEADVVVERTFTTPMVHQGYIEPHACVGNFNEDGQATIWCPTQGHFGVRSMTAMAMGMDEGDIRVIASEIGGGFGGKTTIYLEPLALKLSQKSGRPVKMVMTREDVFRATGPASGTVNTAKIGCKRDGTIVAMYAKLIYEAGAYPGSPLGAGAMCMFAPYDVADVLIEGYEVVVNRPRVAAYRAPGAPQSMFAGECVLDELAEKLGMDPIDFRLKNAAEKGTHAAYGPTFGAIGLTDCLNAAKAHPNYQRPLGEAEGRGIAVGFWFKRRQPVECRGAHRRHGHGQDRRRQPRHRRQPRLHGADGRRDPGGSLRAHPHPRGRHGQHRLLRDDWRQPHDVRHGHGRDPRLRGRDRPAQVPGGAHLGHRRGTGRVVRRRSAAGPRCQRRRRTVVARGPRPQRGPHRRSDLGTGGS